MHRFPKPNCFPWLRQHATTWLVVFSLPRDISQHSAPWPSVDWFQCSARPLFRPRIKACTPLCSWSFVPGSLLGINPLELHTKGPSRLFVSSCARRAILHLCERVWLHASISAVCLGVSLCACVAPSSGSPWDAFVRDVASIPPTASHHVMHLLLPALSAHSVLGYSDIPGGCKCSGARWSPASLITHWKNIQLNINNRKHRNLV